MASAAPTEALLRRLHAVRAHSEALIAELEPEDLCLQGMADASPPKWHLGHTTWFFDTFLLTPHLPGHEPAESRWSFLFNSYYDAIGARHPRPQRGLLSRPPLAAVLAWRRRVDAGLAALVEQLSAGPATAAAPLWELLELGLQHEQQHQELLLMDLLDGFSRNPLEPAVEPSGRGAEATYETLVAAADAAPASTPNPPASAWLHWPGGLVEIGHAEAGAGPEGPSGAFHFDNESPRHRQWLEPFALAPRLVSNGEYAAFIAAGGYRRPELWMSEGWQVCQQRGWQAPRYWRGSGAPKGWSWEFTLAGRRPLHPAAPVRHLSWFEADAYARWAEARLPSEAEWEVAAATPPPAGGSGGLEALQGVLWQWTSSPYRPYPGFRPAAGAVGEYNGKFMSSQMVLRGSSFLTPPGHGRLTYRNFFPPASRWLAGGLRLARDGR
ncbi:ergothioneine biosynthesis protein EgtB [Synechococcus sp. MW101C3]|uniref:ergothioneine biosynthesis protein EgtB n=1 Tax=Synechococcus sp. MW101C3 TaxID=210768 RepID=UPI0018E9F83A|nr:ergothioneine biosynthesis protein EgtB [Synechococcus sp. MW101C3]